MPDKTPPISTDKALELIEAVQMSSTIEDLGIFGWFLYGNCSSHGVRQEAIFEDGVPSQRTFGCRPCYAVGVHRSLAVEDITRI